MTDQERLQVRVRVISRIGLAIAAVTLLTWPLLPLFRPEINGLLLGEAGAAYVVYSMLRQGHLKDGMTGAPLFASGMMGMFTRLVVLGTVMIVAVKTPGINPIATLVGYLLGFVLIFFGLLGIVRTSGQIPTRK
ncbi:MAG: hypothetical protein OWT28_10325 [Firmicutes bacterium]|nr:hypothetical protein [Bacillota bacterium]